MNNLEQIARELARGIVQGVNAGGTVEGQTATTYQLILKALRSVAPPYGWVMVPVKPTVNMLLCMANQKSTLDAWYGALACLPHHPYTDLPPAPKPPEDK